MKNVYLDSDFRDWYDYIFDHTSKDPSHKGFHWNRMADATKGQGLNKEYQFLYLAQADFNIPLVGRVKDMPMPQSGKVVVYTAPLQHCGEGKELLNYQEAQQRFPNSFASEYLDYEVGVSYRVLRIGFQYYIMQYASKNDWRSNCGDCEVTGIKALSNKYGLGGFGKMNLGPMVAIDFVPLSGHPHHLAAIDLNQAPGTKHTGLDHILSPSDLYHLIEDWFNARK